MKRTSHWGSEKNGSWGIPLLRGGAAAPINNCDATFESARPGRSDNCLTSPAAPCSKVARHLLIGRTDPSSKEGKSATSNISSLFSRRGFAAIFILCSALIAQDPPSTVPFDTPDFHVQLLKTSQTIAALQPKSAGGFDFAPSDRLEQRASDGFHALGDLTFRARVGTSGTWQDYSTAAERHPVEALAASATVLAAADLSPTLPSNCPLRVTRRWLLDNGRLVLRFDVQNRVESPVEIGALGLPMIFNNMLRGRRLTEMEEVNSFYDPAINEDGGYLQVTRLNGHGPALLVVPEGKTPFEAWRVLNEPNGPNNMFSRGNPYEGSFEWMVHSKGFAENEWQGKEQWNPPTRAMLAPGETRTYGVKFLVSPEIRDIERTFIANNRPVAAGIPGYILAMELDAKLFLNYPHQVTSIRSEPRGAIAIQENPPTRSGAKREPDRAKPQDWKEYTLRGRAWGRARLSITYDDGTNQALSYYVIKPAPQAVGDLGNFLFTRQWYVDSNDPFHRSPSIMTYDRANNRIVTQDARAWIAGLGDEGGSGSWLAAAMKEFGQPNKDEIAKFELFIDEVLWGNLQYSDGARQYGVRKSLFYYDPAVLPGFPYDSRINWGSWTSWNKASAETVNRAYNYPHVVAAYWALYRVARNYEGLVTRHSWDWYLNQAFQTANYLGTHPNIGNSRDGLMDGTIFLVLLEDLKRENRIEQANTLEAQLKAHAEDWKNRAVPFGSEMAWDSTGQEEIYAVTKFFGYDDKAQITLDSILGYMPLIPHWGYNGSARRFWDFFYGAAPGGTTERQLHHYGSGLNAIPVLSEFRSNPDDVYLLRVGYAGAMGGLSNIDQEGFAGTAFHSFPQNMRWDTYSGDYGPNFFGIAINAGTYVVNHQEFGWAAFGGNVRMDGDWIKVQPRDAFRQRVYVAPRGLWLTLDSGTFDTVEISAKTHAVRIGLSPRSALTRRAVLRIEQPGKVAGIGTYHLKQQLPIERGAHIVPLQSQTSWIELVD